MASSSSSSRQSYDQKRKTFQHTVNAALHEDDDPVGAYDQFVKWTIKMYAEDPQAYGLTKLLEEVFVTFEDDKDAKGDARFVRMCCIYASRVPDPLQIFATMFEKKIGINRATVYIDYARALESAGKLAEADRIYHLGVQKRAKPAEKLETLYKDFKTRTTAKTSPATGSSTTGPIYTHSDKSVPDGPTLHARYGHDRYQYIHAPEKVPGKRPEVLRFNLSLLFTKDGTEYSAAEARARHMGLYGVKQNPLSKSGSTFNVGLNDEQPSTKEGTSRRRSMKAEPTVTLNTKAAMEDVFAMFNSPDRTSRVALVPGSKSAPVQAVTPAANKTLPSTVTTPAFRPAPPQTPSQVNENAAVRTPAFKPFVDNVGGVKENATPAPKVPLFATPDVSRRALGAKTPTPAFSTTTPKSLLSKLQNNFLPIEEQAEQVLSPMLNKSLNVSDKPVAVTPFKVFSREPVFTPKTPAFTPFVDPKPVTPAAHRAPSPESPAQEEFIQEDETEETEEPLQEDTSEEDEEEAEPEYDDEEYIYEAPLGGRFGEFNVMTPITERTFEMTGRTNMLESPTPGSSDEDDDEDTPHDPNFFPAQGPVDSEDDLSEGDQGQSSQAEEDEDKPNTRSLAQYFDLVSSFRPSNPCHPFAANVVQSLLPQLAVSSGFSDIKQDARLFDSLQKFAKKLSRTSSNSNKGTDDGLFHFELAGKRYEALNKLGEGGFGAVFTVRESKDDEDEVSFSDDEDEDENAGMFAMKVVQPRQLWEFHILRRLQRALPARITRSIVNAHQLVAYRDESFLFLDLCSQGTLLDVVNKASSMGIAQQGASLDELLVMFFTVEILRVVLAMHQEGFIHGDLKIDNCLLRLDDVPGGPSALSGIYQPSGELGWICKGVKIIDFGRTIETNLFPKGQTFMADWPVDAKDCIEMRESKPWTYQSDYFGLAGIVYTMLYGKYIDAAAVAEDHDGQGHRRFRMVAPLKRYWQTDIWSKLFDALLNPTLIRADGSLPINSELAEIRIEMENWITKNCNRSSNTLKGLLKKIEVSILSSR